MEKYDRILRVTLMKICEKLMDVFLKITRISPWIVLYGLIDHIGIYQNLSNDMFILAAILCNYLLFRETNLLE